MINLNNVKNIYLYPGKTDFRKGINGLSLLIEDELEVGSLYLFCNYNLTEIKILEVEEDAIWLYQKKLFKNKYQFPKYGNTSLITKDEINLIINGVNLVNKIECKESAKRAIF